MISGWSPALAFAWRSDNDGQPYHVDAHDPGKGTAWGVTESTWSTAVEHGYVEGSLRDADKDALSRVLHCMFWNAIKGDDLPAGVDQVVFDMAMVSGPGRAARLLQRALGVEQDGWIGPLTLNAATLAYPRALIGRLTLQDEAFFGSLSTFTYFGRGWDRRALDCMNAAMARVGEA